MTPYISLSPIFVVTGVALLAKISLDPLQLPATLSRESQVVRHSALKRLSFNAYRYRIKL